MAVLCTILLLAVTATPSRAREIRDGAGRMVTLPAEVSRIFPTSPPASIFVFSLDPQGMLGWTRAPSPEALAFLGPHAIKPTLGWVGGRGGEANFEAVLRMKPNLLIDLGNTDGTYLSLANRIEKTTHLPVLLLNGHIPALPETYRLAGEVLGKTAPANVRADWIARHLDDIRARLAMVPTEKRPRVYLARGSSGLESARMGSINIEALELAGGRNIVGEAMGGGSLVTVSIEQLLTFDPDIIVVLDPALFARMTQDPLWSKLRAVKAGKVVLTPQLPFPWVDFPPSINRVIGVIWLAQLFFPDEMQIDLPTAAREFYRLFYHHHLTDPELAGLLKDAVFK